MAELSRRAFLRGVAGAGAATVLVGLESRPARATLRPVSMATHIHASFSEGIGTMLAHLQQAKATGVDVIWWTEHDFRMAAHDFWEEIHFTGATETSGGLTLVWTDSSTGSFSSRSATFIPSPVSPKDPVASKALRLSAVGRGTAFSFQRRWADTAMSRYSLRGTMAGLTAAIDVRPEAIGPDAFLEIAFDAGYRPATAGRAAGMYSLSYRVGGPDAPDMRRTEGLKGIVTLAAPRGEWTTITVTPCSDLASFWPDLVSSDAGMCEFSIAVASREGATAAGVFDHVRFTRAHSTDAVQLQRQMMEAYRRRFPHVRQHQGLEVSLYQRHVNWYGGDVALPDYTGIPLVPVADDPMAMRDLIAEIQAAGGVASYNHIFGTSFGSDSAEVQASRTRSEITRLVSQRLFGADLLEVAYRRYGKVAMKHHLAVWDACSRNSIFATGVGSSDNHSGMSWLTQANNLVTYAWAEDPSESNLQAAMRSGRCFFADLRRFPGSLDLSVDDTYPMGSVTVSDRATRELRITVKGLPSGGTLHLVQGPVDDAGPDAPTPGVSARAIPMSSVVRGQAVVPIQTDSPTFVRVEVRDASNRLVAGSNPVWSLREPPGSGIPRERAALA